MSSHEILNRERCSTQSEGLRETSRCTGRIELRAKPPVSVPALLPELEIELREDGVGRLAARHWPATCDRPASGGQELSEVDLLDAIARAHREVGTFLRVTVRGPAGVSTEILSPPREPDQTVPAPRPRPVAVLDGFRSGEEVWLTSVVSVEAAGDDGRVAVFPDGVLMLVVAPGTGRVVLVDPGAGDDDGPAFLVLAGTGVRQ